MIHGIILEQFAVFFHHSAAACVDNQRIKFKRLNIDILARKIKRR
jgi:hypothetical protein